MDETVQSREMLIAQRDELIEQLQGEWGIRKSPGSANKNAIKAGLCVFVATLVFIVLVAVPLMFMIEPTDQSEATDLGGSLLVFAGVVFLSSLIVYCIVLVQSLWYQKLNPMHITGSSLEWAKRKGYVPERMNLYNLKEVVGYSGVGMDRVFIRILEKTGGGTFGFALSQCIFISEGDLNTPKFSPAYFENGDQLIGLLAKIAEVNTKLNELGESSD